MTRKEIKLNAKKLVSSGRVNAHLFTLTYLVAIWFINLLDSYVNSDWFINAESLEYYADLYGIDLSTFLSSVPSFFLNPPAFWQHADLPSFTVTLVSILCILLSFILGAGYLLYILGVHQGKEMPYETLFDGFLNVAKILCLRIIIYGICSSLSLFLFVPGIVAAYTYRFSMLNLLENPEMGIMEALKLSRKQTRGFKWKLFLLDLSFLGWDILTFFSCGILNIWIFPWKQHSLVEYFFEAKAVSGAYYLPKSNDGQFHADSDL